MPVARSRAPARAAAAAAGEASKGSWPSADELRRASTGAPDASNHFDVTGVVVAPSFRASRSFLGACHPPPPRGLSNCRATTCAPHGRVSRPLPRLSIISTCIAWRCHFLTPAAAAKDELARRSVEPGPVRVLLLSEGNVCRSLLAEAMLAKRLAARGLGAVVQVESKGACRPSALDCKMTRRSRSAPAQARATTTPASRPSPRW